MRNKVDWICAGDPELPISQKVMKKEIVLQQLCYMIQELCTRKLLGELAMTVLFLDVRRSCDIVVWWLEVAPFLFKALIGMQLPNYGGFAPGEVVIVVLRVRNVVIKATFASRPDEEV